MLAAAERKTRTLCLTLAYTGCRISEALALTAGRIDLEGRALVFETLKRRRTSSRTRSGALLSADRISG